MFSYARMLPLLYKLYLTNYLTILILVPILYPPFRMYYLIICVVIRGIFTRYAFCEEAIGIGS